MRLNRKSIGGSPAMETPPELTSAVAREISRDHAPLRKQVAALSELFDLFTRRREGLRGRSYMDVPALRNAYLRYHLPLNVARATWVLEQVLAVHPLSLIHISEPTRLL